MDNCIGGAPGPGSTMSSLGSGLVSNIQEELFVQGKAFSFEDYFSFAADETKTFIVDPTAFTGVQIVANPLCIYATAGPVEIDIYANSTADDDGTLLVPSNRRADFPPPVSVIRLNPNNIVHGTRFGGDLIPSTGVSPATAIGGGNSPSLPFEIIPTIKYEIAMHNTNGAGVVLEFKLTWFEI